MFPFKVELFTLMLFKQITSLSYHEVNKWPSYTPSLKTIFKFFLSIKNFMTDYHIPRYAA